MFDADQPTLILAAASALMTLGFFFQWFRAIGARRRCMRAEALVQDRDAKVTVASSRGAQLEQEYRALQVQLERARNELATERDELRRLKELVSTRPTRVQHDVSRRLNTVSLRIQDGIRSKDLRNALVRELQVITEKLELHVSDNIAKFVENRSEDFGVTADGISIWEIARHVIALENYSNVHLDLDEDMILEGHWIHWELLLSQLISNAVEHASRVGGQVRVAVVPEGSRYASIQITNDGEHIPEENLDRVFESGFTTKQTGSGMGLYIARQVVAGLGGRIERPENVLIRRSRLAFRRTPGVRFTVKHLPVLRGTESEDIGLLPISMTPRLA